MKLIKVVIVKQSKNWLSKKKNIRNLAKFKSLKNSIQYKKLIKNLIKLKISKECSFLSLTIKLASIKLG